MIVVKVTSCRSEQKGYGKEGHWGLEATGHSSYGYNKAVMIDRRNPNAVVISSY